MSRRSTGVRALHALREIIGEHGDVLSSTETGWQSVTFSGIRYAATLHFEGAEACQAGEQLVDGLADHPFAIAGKLVADASVARVDRTMLPIETLTTQVELLILDAGDPD